MFGFAPDSGHLTNRHAFGHNGANFNFKAFMTDNHSFNATGDQAGNEHLPESYDDLVQALDGDETSQSLPINDTKTLKQFFDWLRDKQANKRLTQAQVDAANELLAVMRAKQVQTALTQINGWGSDSANQHSLNHQNQTKSVQMHLSDKGLALLAKFEGFRSHPYLDSAGVPTIGFGTTYYPNGKKVTMSDTPITKDKALSIKKQIIEQDFGFGVNLLFADEIKDGTLSQNAFDALVSLAYNIGIGALKKSSVYRHIKAGNKKAAADAFLAWNKARVGGRLTVLSGLSRRRTAERALFLA